MEKLNDYINKCQIQSFVKWIYDLSPLELISIGCVISIMICECTTVNEQNVLGNFLEMVGQILLTANAQATTVNPTHISASIVQLDELKAEIYKILNSKITKQHYNRN